MQSPGNGTSTVLQQQQDDRPLPILKASRSAQALSQSTVTVSCELPAGAPSELQFTLPVDHEHKAVELRLRHFARPHMRVFHVSWICLFLTFTTTFAPAALLPVLQDALNLSRQDISNAGIASVCGTIFSRVAMGTMVDAVGPRYSAAIAMLLTAPVMFGMALMQTAAGFIALRMLVGLNLGMFVVDQKWMHGMFNRKVLGRATALSAGWGNTGFGVTLLLMPLLYKCFTFFWGPQVAWRAAFFVPAGLQLLAGMLVLPLTDDTPEGRLPHMARGWCRPRSSSNSCSSLAGWQAALLNPRLYLLAGAYAACFGMELVVANIVSLYLFNQFGLSLTVAGLLGGLLGLMNIVSRFLGGAASDKAASSRGMRGRMWVMFILLLLQGVMCLLVGISHDSLAATLAMLFPSCFFGQMACGAVFGIVPFLSHRRTGLTIGMVAAGGNVGAAVMQALFFGVVELTPYEGFYWMGAAVTCLGALSCLLLYWPMWGGICCGPNLSVTEERFYLSEYSTAERAAGVHLAVLAFAHEAHRERDPIGARPFRVNCDGVLPRVQLPYPLTCCCQQQCNGTIPDVDSAPAAAPPCLPPALPPCEQQQQQGQGKGLGAPAAAPGAPAPSVQLVPIDAACSTAGSTSTGRDSGSGRGDRLAGSHAAHAQPHPYHPPAPEGAMR